MKVALLLTGELRTLERTQQTILANLIIPNNASVFIHAENKSYDQTTKTELSVFTQYWGNHVKAAMFLSAVEQREYKYILDYLWNCKAKISETVFKAKTPVNREYLRNSGTIIEYYQIWKCYQLMRDYEKQQGQQFDLIIRSRLDAIFTLPLICANYYAPSASVADLSQTELFRWIQCFGQPQMMAHGDPPEAKFCQALVQSKAWQNYRQDRNLGQLVASLPMVHCFRRNVVWVAARELVTKIAPLIYHFGDYDNGDPYSWNSENQFQSHLLEHNMIWSDYHPEVQEHYLISKSSNLHVLIKTDKGWVVNTGVVDPKLVLTVIRPESYPYFARP